MSQCLWRAIYSGCPMDQEDYIEAYTLFSRKIGEFWPRATLWNMRKSQVLFTHLYSSFGHISCTDPMWHYSHTPAMGVSAGSGTKDLRQERGLQTPRPDKCSTMHCLREGLSASRSFCDVLRGPPAEMKNLLTQPTVGRAEGPAWLKKIVSPNGNALVDNQTRDANARFPPLSCNLGMALVPLSWL